MQTKSLSRNTSLSAITSKERQIVGSRMHFYCQDNRVILRCRRLVLLPLLPRCIAFSGRRSQMCGAELARIRSVSNHTHSLTMSSHVGEREALWILAGDWLGRSASPSSSTRTDVHAASPWLGSSTYFPVSVAPFRNHAFQSPFCVNSSTQSRESVCFFITVRAV